MFKFKYKFKRQDKSIEELFKKERDDVILKYIKNKRRNINVYGLNGKFIKTYNNFDDVSKKLNVRKSYIRWCCVEGEKFPGFVYSTCGYQFKFYNGCIKDIKPVKDYQKEKSIKINQYDLLGKYLNTFNSLVDASKKLKHLGVSKGGISACINGKTKTAYGFQWKKYNNSMENISSVKYSINIKKILQFDLLKNKIKEYKSISEASKATNLSYSSIYRCLLGKQKSSGAFIFTY